MRWLTLTALLLWTLGCSSAPPGPLPAGTVVDNPAAPGSAQPDLAPGPDGQPRLSWVEPLSDGSHRLQVARWDGERFTSPETLTRGTDWFVNWADFPSVVTLSDGTLAAHWLERSGEQTYAYDVRLTLDGSAPLTPHRDGTPTEHGFVSLVPRPDGDLDVIWLDGREMVDGGAMTLRAAVVARDGSIRDEVVLDERVCDCCQTAAVRLDDDALVVAYRDRGAEEVRDIGIARRVGGEWHPAGTVHDDGWVMPACPVNGPALAVGSGRLEVAWFTQAGAERGAVWLARSTDGGRRFDTPVRIDEGRPAGRVDLLIDGDGRSLVSWLEQGQVLARRVDADGKPGPPLLLGQSDDARASGFPRMLATPDGEILAAWTVPGEPSTLRTVRLDRSRE